MMNEIKLRLIVMVACTAVCAATGFVHGVEAEEFPPRDARAELAKELLEPLSFNIGDYFFIQEDLKKYISELSVRNPAWGELKRCHECQDYLGMLGILNGEKLRDYPSEETIRRLYTQLVGNAGYVVNSRIGYFELSISLTRKIKIVCRGFPGKDTGTYLGQGLHNRSWSFKIKGGKCFYICSPDERINSIISRYTDARDHVREDMKLARIFKEEGEEKIADLCERQYNDTLRWLATAKVVAGDPIAGRVPLNPSFWRVFNGERKKSASSGQSGTVGANDSYKSTADGSGGFVTCEECKGRKTVPDEMICVKCDGVGSIVRQSWIKDMAGNSLPPKKVKCAKCRGMGVVNVGRKPCETCDGKGRVPR